MISAGLPIDSGTQQSYSYCNEGIRTDSFEVAGSRDGLPQPEVGGRNNRIRNLQGWVKFPIGGKAREPKGRIR